MLLREIMTSSVVTASPRTPVRQVAELMRDRNVGSVVLAAGDRLSRIVQPEDHEYYPARPLGEREPGPDDIATDRAPEA